MADLINTLKGRAETGMDVSPAKTTELALSVFKLAVGEGRIVR